MPDYKIEIIVKGVGTRDIDDLVNHIENEYGKDFDAANDEFTIRVAIREGSSWFPHEVEREEW